MSIFLTLCVVAIALVGFISEWFPIDITAIGVIVALIVLGLVTLEAGIAGLGDSAPITIMAMFIPSTGIACTGVIQTLTNRFIEWSCKHLPQQIVVMGSIVGSISAFINNTAVVAVFLPLVEDWCRQRSVSPSKLLLPLSYVTILGGVVTLIGTSTNRTSGLSGKLDMFFLAYSNSPP